MGAMPVLALVTSGAGTQPNIAIEFGHAPAGKTVSTGAGCMYHLESIQVKVNGSARYLPLTTAAGYLTGGRFGTTTLSAEVANRGMFYFTEGTTGVADLLYCIMKETDDGYSAVQVAIGASS